MASVEEFGFRCYRQIFCDSSIVYKSKFLVIKQILNSAFGLGFKINNKLGL